MSCFNYNVFLIISTIFLSISLPSCHAQPPAFNVNTFPSSYRDAAKAIQKEDTEQLERIIKESRLDVNYQDPRFNISLLEWAIYNRKYNSCEKLLALGADPNKKDTLKQFVPPVTMAAQIHETSSFLKLLLDYGGNPNAVSNKTDSIDHIELSPLCSAVGASLQNVQLLINRGADVNLSPDGKIVPLTVALLLDKIDIAKYLIIEKKANVRKVVYTTLDNKSVTIENLLRLNVFPLDSKEYQDKMQIVAYLKSMGIDYKTAPIPKFVSDKYPKEFLDKY